MYPEDQGILAQPKKPGPLARAVAASGIAGIASQPAMTEQQGGQGITAGLQPTDPDTDGRRQYSPGYGDAFANRGGSFAPSGPSNGPDSTALTPAAQGILASSQTGSAPVSPGATRGITQLSPTERIAAQPNSTAAVANHLHATMAQPGTPKAIANTTINEGSTGTSAFAAPTPAPAGIAAPPVGRNDQGVITADSASAAMTNPMTRSGGIAGSYDGKGVNDILARENAARGSMIDSMIKAQGGNGIAVMPDHTNDANEQLQAMKLSPKEYLDYQQGKSRQEAAVNDSAAKNEISMRSHELHAKTEAARLAGNPITNALNVERTAGQQLQNEQEKRLGNLQQQLGAESDPAKRAAIAGQIRELTGRTDKATQGETLTLPQVRSNFEIDAARKAVSGLTPEEIKRKTSNYTATGRENPDFDPTLAKAVSLSNRRKYGADDHFDQRQQAQQPEGSDGDVQTRFRADAGMKGHTMGKQTDQGVEVLDASGKLIGHYR